MLSLKQALATITAIAKNMQLNTEIIPTAEALHRINAEDLRSRLDSPPFTKAAMDGYAVLTNDERAQYEIIETVAAGATVKKTLTPGKTIKIMTGAPVPVNTGKIIRLEYITEEKGAITINTPELNHNICQQGEDLKCGDLILKANSKITPLIIGNLISCGIETIKIKRRLKIAIISTGDEIVEKYELCQLGKIMNLNGPLLASLCQKHNLEVIYQTCVSDQKQQITAAINHALQFADIIILSGGASVGDFDFIKPAFEAVKLTTHFNSIAIKPGKPTIFASTADNKLVFGLPGNPVAVYLTFHLLILKAAQKILGLEETAAISKYVLNKDINRKDAERTEYRPCRLISQNIPKGFHFAARRKRSRAAECTPCYMSSETSLQQRRKMKAEGYKIELTKYNGSAHLSALTQSDGFAIIPAGITTLSAGEAIEVLIISD